MIGNNVNNFFCYLRDEVAASSLRGVRRFRQKFKGASTKRTGPSIKKIGIGTGSNEKINWHHCRKKIHWEIVEFVERTMIACVTCHKNFYAISRRRKLRLSNRSRKDFPIRLNYFTSSSFLSITGPSSILLDKYCIRLLYNVTNFLFMYRLSQMLSNP